MDQPEPRLVTIELPEEACILVAIACRELAHRLGYDIMWAKSNCLATEIILKCEGKVATLESVADLIELSIPKEKINARSRSVRDESPTGYDGTGKGRRASVQGEHIHNLEHTV